MKRVAIIGHTGYVGGFLHRLFPFASVFNSTSIDKLDRTQGNYDVCYCAGISAVKWWANKHSCEDMDNIQTLLNRLTNLDCSRLIFFSTIDVYNNNTRHGQAETDLDSSFTTLLSSDHHAYGRNRLYAEQEIRRIFGDKAVIVRLCGLFGFGLKKNVIFDFMHNRELTLHPEDQFQWYSLEWLAQDLQWIKDNWDHVVQQGGCINLFTEPTPNKELIALFQSYRTPPTDDTRFQKTRPAICYDTCTQFTPSGYWKSKTAVMHKLKEYLDTMVLNHGIQLSNLAFAFVSATESKSERKEVTKYHLQSLEAAPCKLFGNQKDFIDSTVKRIKEIRGAVSVPVYSFQALFYPRKDLHLVTQYNATLLYLQKLCDIAHNMGVCILVFGSPKIRFLNDASQSPAKFKKDRHTALRFFTAINDYLEAKEYNDITICLEPNARAYGCNFLTTSSETIAFLQELNKPRIQLVLDTGCMYMEGETIADALTNGMETGLLKHVHFSAPQLKPLSSFQDKISYSWLRVFLRQKLKYTGKITLEMLNCTPLEIDHSLYCVLKQPDIDIVGAGWYGCHLAQQLIAKTGFNVRVFERNKVFCGASSKNQNRLHWGFHYPRSGKTRSLCKRNHDTFLQEYGPVCVVDAGKHTNIYGIATDSFVDFETFLQVMRAEELEFTVLDFKETVVPLSGCQGLIAVTEEFICPTKAARFFRQALDKQLVVGKDYVGQKRGDLVIDCSNGGLKLLTEAETKTETKSCFQAERTISLVYQLKPDSPLTSKFCLTIMDGPFVSLYPWNPEERKFTLTHVVHSHINDVKIVIDDVYVADVVKPLMEKEILKFFPTFHTHFQHDSYFISNKMRMTCKSDSRHLHLQYQGQCGNQIQILCGKITGIYDMVKQLEYLFPHSN